MGVGMPEALKLLEFGQRIRDAFGDVAYQVGSSITKKRGWRDVDVRLILSDEKYETMGLGDPKNPFGNARWVALCLAFSTLGREMTGLPIDFQIQQRSRANQEYNGNRGALIALWRLRQHKEEEKKTSEA